MTWLQDELAILHVHRATSLNRNIKPMGTFIYYVINEGGDTGLMTPDDEGRGSLT